MSEKVGVAVKKPESKGKDSALTKTKVGFSPSVDINSPVGQMLYLQRTIGNRAVSRLIRSGVLQAKGSCGGSDAAAIATEINAKAFTTGSDIFFGAGQYSPRTTPGKNLLAHELTHVLQQHPGKNSSLKMIRKIDNGNIFLQRYSLNGFSTTDAKTMDAAIASAISTVKSCNALSWYGKSAIPLALASKRYDYVKDLGYCGWTFPGSWYIEVGPKAFTSSCCRLDSTLAHEAAHTELYTEGAAYKMECDCFNCGCSKG